MRSLYTREQILDEAIKRIEAGNLQDAINYLKKALLLDQNSIELMHFLGLTLANLSEFDEAREIFLKVISIDANIAEAHYNLGRIEEILGNTAKALIFYQKAIGIAPNFLEALSSLGVLLNNCHRYPEALALHKRVIELNPNIPDGWAHAGMSCAGLLNYIHALSFINKALEIDPDFPFLLGYQLHLKMRICDWDNFSFLSKKLVGEVLLKKKVSEPFAFLTLSDSVEAQKICAEVWSNFKFPEAKAPTYKFPKKTKAKLRIGYFSPDFREHAVSFLAAELFELHNRDQFEIIAFSLLNVELDGMRKRLIAGFDKFIDVEGLSDREIAALAREMEVDIAVDLGGFTQNCRPEIFSYRAAPVQISYLGYLGTMGSGFIDYLIADKLTIPKEFESFYSEKIIYLPSYQVNDRLRRISDKKLSRSDFGLPEDKFVFCCLNSSFKILPEVFDGWLRILKSVEESVLYLQADSETIKINLTSYAVCNGVDPERLIFARRLPPSEYLAQYLYADLFLDTFPYNAGTTASDALWAGLPVLTRVGDAFCSRVAASVLTAAGLPELITHSQAEYEDMAIRFATNHNLLLEFKERVNQARLNSPLFDTPSFVASLEKAYQLVYQRYQAGFGKVNLDLVSADES